MKRILILIVAAGALALQALNVRDCGAVGDGVADDTQAIQQAISRAEKMETFFLAGHSEASKWGGHGGHGGYAEVYFPAGVYRITGTLVVPNRKIMLRGEPGAIIVQEDAAKDILFWNSTFRVNVENLIFRGGAIQLNFFTNNNDMTMVTIRDCRFEDAGVLAIRCDNDARDGKGLPFYQVEWRDGVPQLTANDLEGSGRIPNSTLLTVRDSSFDACRQVMTASCDLTLFTDCDVVMDANAADAAFVMSNNVNMYRVQAYSRSVPRPGQVWIRHGLYGLTLNGGHFYGEKLDFDNAGDAGMCLLTTNTRPGYVSCFVRLLDSVLKSAGSSEGSFIRIDAGTHPSILTVTGNTERSGRPVRAISYEKEPTADELQNEIRYQPWKELPIRNFFKVRVAGNSLSVNGTVPFALESCRDEVIPAMVYAAVAIPRLPASVWPQIEEYPLEIRAAIPDNAHAAAAIQQALDLARPGSRVVLPGGAWLNIDRTLTVPDDVALVGEGMALLVMAEGVDQPILRLSGAGRSLIRNIGFANGSVGAALDGGSGVANFENCGFFDQKEYGVVAKGDALLRVAGGIFFTNGGVSTEAGHGEFTANWICNGPEMDEKGFSRVGGELLADFNLFVPILPRTPIEDGRQAIPELAGAPGGNNVRWFDNYGRLHSRNNRLGGEFMGMTPVYNFTDSGSILLEGAYNWFGNHYTRRCHVYCPTLPRMIVLNDIICNTEGAFGALDAPYHILVPDPKGGEDLRNPPGLPAGASGIIPYAN